MQARLYETFVVEALGEDRQNERDGANSLAEGRSRTHERVSNVLAFWGLEHTVPDVAATPPPAKKNTTEEPETLETWDEEESHINDQNWSRTGRRVRFVTDSQILQGILTGRSTAHRKPGPIVERITQHVVAWASRRYRPPLL